MQMIFSRSRRVGAWLALAGWLAAAAPTHAAEPDDEGVDLTDEFAFLQEEADVVITASRHEQKTGFSPAAVIVITRREIEASGATTLSDLLRRYPAVHVYEFDPLYPTAEIRGTYRVMMLLDGREVNIELFVSPFYALLPVGLHEIERIEIVLGPNSALYGANAVSAVINVVTRKAEPGFGADAELAAGEHGTALVHGRLEGGAGPATFSGSAGIDRADSWMQQDVRAKDVVRAHGRARLDLPDGSLSIDGSLVRGAGRIFALLGYLESDAIWMTHVRTGLELGDLKARVYWYRAKGDLDLELKLIHPDLGLELGTVPTIEMTGDTLQSEAQYDLEPFEHNLLILGADYRYTRYHAPQFVVRTIHEHRVGVYVHDEHRFFERLALTVGARLDWNSRTDLAFSPRGALVYNPAAEHYLRLSAGTAFRKPSIMETSTNFRVDANPAFPEVRDLFEQKGISNPDLGNENLTTIELGYRANLLEHKLRLSVDAWAGFNRDIIGFETDVRFEQTGMGPRIDVENSVVGYATMEEDTNALGLHLEVEGEPVEALTLFARGELRHVWYVKDGSTDPTYPGLLTSAGALLRLRTGLTAELTWLYVASRKSGMRNPYSILQPSYWLEIPARSYLFTYVSYGLEFGHSRLDLGLSLFKAFGARRREEPGVITRSGTNYGGELIGPRALLTARLRY